MTHNNGKRSLEKLSIFPYVAWALTIGFAYFVYTIAVDLQDTAATLKAQTNALEAQIQAGSHADFDAYANRNQSASTTEQ